MHVSNNLSNIYDIVVTITMLYSLYLLFWKKYKKRQRHFYLYITIIFLIDTVGISIGRKYFEIDQFYFYFPLFIFTISYFAYFFGKDYKDKVNKTILYLLTFIAFILLFVFQIKNDKLLVISTTTILVVILYQLILCLQWFWYIVNHADEQNIIHKQAFWVSCALLIWSTFALFRMYPMYDLIKIDSAFLATIIDFFQVVNIITYLLYIRGLRCTDYNILRTFNHF